MDKRIKFTKEQKIAIVKRYLEDGIGSTSLAREVGCNHQQILKWVYEYKEHGKDAFRDSLKHKAYTKEFQSNAVECYFQHGSINQTAAKYCEKLGISSKILNTPNFLYTDKLKSYSGTDLHKLVIAFRVALHLSVEEYLGTSLPFVLDSPSGEN